MRKVTKNIVGVLSLGVLATSWSVGQAAQTGLGFGTGTTSAGSESTTATPAPAASETTAPTASATPSTTDAGSNSSSATAKTKAPTAAPTKTAAPTASATPTPAAAKKANAQTGSAIQYKYGVIQVEVVKSGSTITAVNLVQSSTRGQQYAVVPGMLVEAAVAANGSNFGNVSGATFTTQAFKSALESALAKF